MDKTTHSQSTVFSSKIVHGVHKCSAYPVLFSFLIPSVHESDRGEIQFFRLPLHLHSGLSL